MLKVVREQYIRSDLGFGSISRDQVARLHDQVSVVNALRDEHREKDGSLLLVIPDTNVVLRQLDALQSDCPAVYNLVLCDTVYKETKRLEPRLQSRLLSMIRDAQRSTIVFSNENHASTVDSKLSGESDGDFNDRLIRKVVYFFASKLFGVRVVFLSEDTECLARFAKEEAQQRTGAVAMRMNQFAASIAIRYPTFSDSLHFSVGSARVQPNERLFEEYKSKDEMDVGLRSKKYYQGVLRTGARGEDVVQSSVLLPELIRDGEPVRAKILDESSINRGIDGDLVCVETFPMPPAEDGMLNQYGARVVGMVRKTWRAYAGTIIDEANVEDEDLADMDAEELGGMQTMTFLPIDVKIPKILIRSRNRQALQKDRLVVQMDAWDSASKFPTGHVVQSLGPIGDNETETRCALFEYDIPTSEFSSAVMDCLPSPGQNWKADTEGIPAWRIDLRSIEQVCSVDPPGCQDIDDALHCRISPNDPTRLEVGVHIADVSHFVLPDTPMDLEARRRGTSTYLVERRLDMLPTLLTTQICSLRCDVDRFSFSVLWELDAERMEFLGEPRFVKSCIRSRASLSYDQAQKLIDAQDESTLGRSIRGLHKIAAKLRDQRLENGALALASQEMKFELDHESENPTAMKEYEHTESHWMVEEFMLLANVAVAERVQAKLPSRTLLRRHQRPSAEMLNNLQRAAAVAQVKLDVSSSKALADSLDRAEKADQPFFNQLLRIMTTRAMQQAQYFCSGDADTRDDFLHYGLAVPMYTHFTSPIRRYADLVVHRLLASCEGYHSLPQTLERKEEISKICINLNQRHRNAQKASRASSSLFACRLFRNKQKPVDTVGYVSGVSANRVTVLVPEFGLEEPLEGLDEDCGFGLKPEDHVVTLHGKVAFRIFDKVSVRVFVRSHQLDQRESLVVQLSTPEQSVKRVKDTKAGSSKRWKQSSE